MGPQADAGARPERSPPFFIMGCQGSGNNLVGLILARHSRISVYLGTHYYVLFAADRHRYGDLSRPPNLARLIRDFHEMCKGRGLKTPEPGEIREALVEPTFEGVLAAFLRSYARAEGKARVGERTSQHYLYLREILDGFPESPVIFTARDPRDTAVTLRGGLGTSLIGTIRAWNRAFAAYCDAPRPVHLVRYEDLVRTPAATVAGICEFLGERYEPAMLRFFENTPASVRALPHHRKLSEPLDAGSVGEFKQMPPGEIDTIEAGCADGMRALQYAFAASPPDRRQTAPPEARRVVGSVIDRWRYYRWNPERWRRGLLRWKIVLRVRARYVLMLGFRRKDW